MAHFKHFSLLNPNLWNWFLVYSLTFWPKLAHFKHFSLQNQNLWNWFLVKIGQNTKPIALLFGQNWPILSTFHCKIKIFEFCPILTKNQFQRFLVKNFGQNTKPIGLLFCPILTKASFLSTLTFAKWKVLWKFLANFGQNTKPIALVFCQNFDQKSFSKHFSLQNQKCFEMGQNWAKYQAYSLTFWPKLAHFKHFSLQNQNLWNWFLVKIGQNTKPIALLFGQNWPILSTFHCKIKIFEIDFWSKLGKIPSL